MIVHFKFRPPPHFFPQLALAGQTPSPQVSRMNLEDHLGDIIRKGRTMSGVAASAAAGAAGLSEAELAALEASGQTAKHPDWMALGQAVGLNGEKLQRIAQGWLPSRKDLNAWQHLRWFTTAGDELTVNCFLVWDQTTRAAALFDTGFDAQVILDVVAKEQLQLRYLFITHSHYDHVDALGAIRSAQPQAEVRVNSRSAPARQRLQLGESFSLGSLRISFRETPGHAADGVTYVVSGWPNQAPDVAMVGDAIFAGSMGRGNDGWDLARAKVREQILTLPPETLLCPGHGPLTTVAEELAHNPFF